MMRIVLFIIVLVLTFTTSADAGWLDEKLKKAADSIGDRLIDDAADSTYEGTKDVVTPEEDTQSESPGRYGDPEEAIEYEEQVEAADEYYPEYGGEEMDQSSWGGGSFGMRSKRKKKTGPPRTDLHFSTEMVVTDPEASPEPFRGDIYIDGARSRTEWNYPDGSKVGVIVTGIKPDDKVYVLMHNEKSYMVSSAQEDSDSSFAFGSDKPCEGFLKAEDLGKTKLNGRSVSKWRCSQPEDPEDAEEAGSVLIIWYDKKLKIPIRMEDNSRESSWELTNIRVGKPSADHFKVPADYKKLEVGAIPTASSLPDQHEKQIKSAGVPIYSKARFVYGNPSVGYRFASSEPVEKVRDWYRNKLSSWPVYEDRFGSWIIYKGKPGANMSQLVLQKTQVSIQKNDKLPEWHSLDKYMTTEIVVFIDE
jgi:hypothetical protein